LVSHQSFPHLWKKLWKIAGSGEGESGLPGQIGRFWAVCREFFEKLTGSAGRKLPARVLDA